ncbi:uncharacterized protein LOC143586979 [Bidens hawaiensis]|uniref:uncharacterized protein LOC143586979 n=1 Tax=Bidens hawaiensis TaxID=980011 RepID=UPI00404AC4F8
MDTGLVAVYNFKWNKWVPLKVEVLAWRKEMERIPSLVSLVRRNANMPSMLCPICGKTEELSEHLFVSCNFTQATWKLIDQWCKVPFFFSFSFRGLLEMFKVTRLPKRKAKAFHAVCLTTIWCLWKARNDAVFNGKLAQLNIVSGGIKALGFFWVRNRSKSDAITWENWRSFNL